jgi:hypothetical protein
MLPYSSGRNFVLGLGGMAASSFFGRSVASALFPAVSGRFKLSVITDEITQDLGHALEIASKEFGLAYVELRTMWNKNIINLEEKETAEARPMLEKYGVQVRSWGSSRFRKLSVGIGESCRVRLKSHTRTAATPPLATAKH